jgi:hypothetical protein
LSITEKNTKNFSIFMVTCLNLVFFDLCFNLKFSGVPTDLKISNFDPFYKLPTEESYKYLVQLSCKACDVRDVNSGPGGKLISTKKFFEVKKLVKKNP